VGVVLAVLGCLEVTISSDIQQRTGCWFQQSCTAMPHSPLTLTKKNIRLLGSTLDMNQLVHNQSRIAAVLAWGSLTRRTAQG
jgi:hypothetical protein